MSFFKQTPFPCRARNRRFKTARVREKKLKGHRLSTAPTGQPYLDMSPFPRRKIRQEMAANAEERCRPLGIVLSRRAHFDALRVTGSLNCISVRQTGHVVWG